eukprot:TRINITY_DN7944_c0_g1_i1.p1 TRINITY_DN7944_c0_g1~~TRINITY_DN7944_c0_g1_i1.p1  ORF type:complete len:386 (-),score=58.62 TRINITY_DN7944_c0_g1_i1:92-1183(-)
MWTVHTAAPRLNVEKIRPIAHALLNERDSGNPLTRHLPALPAAWHDRYEFVTSMPVIGQGAYGTVFQVRCRHSLQPFACKVMQRHFLEVRGMGAQIGAEIQTMKHASASCRVVRLLEFAEERGLIFLVLELCPFGNLFHELSAHPEGFLPEERVRRCAEHLLQGLMDLHSFGILHRDIKMENLLVTTGGSLKITDFGWATTIQQARTDLAGSFHAMAPEILRGEPQTSAVDVWSAGIVLFQLAVGRPLLNADIGDDSAALAIQRHPLLCEIQRLCPLQPAARPAHVSELCWDLIRWLLTPAVAARPTASQALQHKWLSPMVHNKGFRPSFRPALSKLPTATPSSTPRSSTPRSSVASETALSL